MVSLLWQFAAALHRRAAASAGDPFWAFPVLQFVACFHLGAAAFSDWLSVADFELAVSAVAPQLVAQGLSAIEA